MWGAYRAARGANSGGGDKAVASAAYLLYPLKARPTLVSALIRSLSLSLLPDFNAPKTDVQTSLL